ncbi:MAG: hypothetical protein DRG33_03720 [Deltaproteobacteria bacterium]|nr:MAG: hypothetical protein DRG33_03720 [Deltaproteobacteria bacterium]
MTFVLVVPPALTGFAFGRGLFLSMYGEAMSPGASLCAAFFLVFMISFLVMPLRMALYVQERAGTNFAITAMGAVINLGLDLLLIPRYGIRGAIAPVAIAILATGLLQYVASRRLMRELDIPWRDLGKVLVASLPALPAWFFLRGVSQPPLVLGGIVATAFIQYWLIRRIGVLGKEERELIASSNLPAKGLIIRVLFG